MALKLELKVQEILVVGYLSVYCLKLNSRQLGTLDFENIDVITVQNASHEVNLDNPEELSSALEG